MNLFRSLIVASGLAFATAANAAINFSNFNYGADPAGLASHQSIVGNTISWSPLTVSRGGATPGLLTISWSYDATSTSGAISSILASATSPLSGFTSGNGSVKFQETVVRLDSHGNEIGTPDSTGNISLSGTGTIPVTTLSLSTPSVSVRVKKTLVLAANAASFAGVSGLSQTIQTVPEPASMAALGLGIAGLLRRRKRA